MTGVPRAEPELPDFLLGPEPPSRQAEPTRRKPSSEQDGTPGEQGLWIFILGDMTLFGAFFAVFLWEARGDRELFAASARELLLPIGTANTLMLLASSLFTVIAVRSAAASDTGRTTRALAAVIGCAAVFATLKIVEYVHEIGAGNTPDTNLFFTFYFVLTGIHFLHVVVGVVLLSGPRPTLRFVEGAGVYWHMVDLLWVVIFSLLYVSGTA